MIILRGVFKVTQVTKFRGTTRIGALVRLESTKASAELFGATLDLMTTDEKIIKAFELDKEVLLEATPL